MEKIVTLEEALKRITELEKENATLREELEYYKNRKLSGRQKHNEKWMAIYHDFVAGYESGMTFSFCLYYKQYSCIRQFDFVMFFL